MAVFVALLRAVNVGTTGKLLMKELVSLCEACGFDRPQTYIQSGNVVFASELAEAKVKAALEQALTLKLKKSASVIVRSTRELELALAHNPFKQQKPNFTVILFLDESLPKQALTGIRAPDGEQVASLGREVFVYYPVGQGKSKLRLPFASTGTGRNLNTVAKLLAMAKAREATQGTRQAL